MKTVVIIAVLVSMAINMNGQSGLEEIRLTVDYGKSWEEMLSRGRYDFVDSRVTKDNFPIPDSLMGKRQIVYVRLFCFHRCITSKEVMAEMEKQGYRPANLFEIMSFAEGNPDMQRRFPISALASVYWDNVINDYRVPTLSGSRFGRILGVSEFGVSWGGLNRFLGVREND